VPLAIIQLSFDPYLRLGGQGVRWATIALVGVIFLALLLAALAAGRRPATSGPGRRLRRDDLLFIILGIVPGAVIGGRLGYVLLHLDYYRANPGLVIDPSSGGLALTGAIVLGTLTGAYVAGLLEAPIGRWLDLTAVALVVGLGLGKLTQVLDGSGQGILSNAGWATAYTGPGPWGVLGPALPALPVQVYEAIGDAVLCLVVLVLGRLAAFQGGHGRRFAVALAGWAIVRFVVALWWRDATVLGALKVEQLTDLAILLVALVALAGLARRPATIAQTTPSGHPPPASSGA
jgi:phosphatidylglycerol---prolipoprotein diacylglyceryl transferase